MDKGTRLRLLREAKMVSQTDASLFLGISKQTLYKYEKNIVTNIPSDVIERMAKYYDTTPAYIMGWGEESEVPHDISNEDRKLLDVYHALSPETRAAVDLLIKADQQKP